MQIDGSFSFSNLTSRLSVVLSMALLLSSCAQEPQEVLLGSWSVPGSLLIMEFLPEGSILFTTPDEVKTGEYRFLDDQRVLIVVESENIVANFSPEERGVTFLKGGEELVFTKLSEAELKALLEELKVAQKRLSDRMNAPDKVRATMSDMTALAMAWEAFGLDNDVYEVRREPVVGNEIKPEEMEKALVPLYFTRFPSLDAWGNRYRFLTTADGHKYRIISEGADRKLDNETRLNIDARPQDAGAVRCFENDIVYENGEFLVYPDPDYGHSCSQNP